METCVFLKFARGALLKYEQTLKENNRETVMWHMYGLTKIFELRGPSGIRCDVQPDKNLLLSCITLSVSSKNKGKKPIKQETAQKLAHHHPTLLTRTLDWSVLC